MYKNDTFHPLVFTPHKIGWVLSTCDEIHPVPINWKSKQCHEYCQMGDKLEYNQEMDKHTCQIMTNLTNASDHPSSLWLPKPYSSNTWHEDVDHWGKEEYDSSTDTPGYEFHQVSYTFRQWEPLRWNSPSRMSRWMWPVTWRRTSIPTSALATTSLYFFVFHR